MAGRAPWPAPDRLPAISALVQGRRGFLEPRSAADDRALRADAARGAGDCGPPAPPPGRVWMLRSPWPTVGPDDHARLTTPRAERGAELSEAQTVAWTHAAGSAPRVLRWRHLGLSADPLGGLGRLLRDRDPEEVQAWLDDGFSLLDTAMLSGMALAGARDWRAAGFSRRRCSNCCVPTRP